MAEAQGALEYLIVVSVSLAVLAAVTMLATNYFSTGKSDYAYSACKEAASRCYMAISGNPSEPCLFCNNACNYSNGTEIFTKAVTCCKLGKLSDIYAGSLGCTAPVVPVCGNGVMEGSEKCDNGVVCNCPSSCPSSCAPDCTCQHLPSACSFAPLKTFVFGDHIYSLAVGNVDQDPEDEIIAGIHGSAGYELVMYKYNGVDWDRTVIKNTPTPVYSIAIGDVDNDLANEVAIGLDVTLNETRSYKYSGTWSETNISDLPIGVSAVAVGNVDNDAYNDVVIGTVFGLGIGNPYSLRLYENFSGGWKETNISSSYAIIHSIDTGDVDQDTKSEIVVAFKSTDYELKMYKNMTGIWKETGIVDVSNSVNTVSVGNADNDGYIDVLMGGEFSEGIYMNKQLRTYTNKSGTWIRQNLGTDWGSMSVFASVIGDVDDDGFNEAIGGGTLLGGGGNFIRMYEYLSGAWVRKNVMEIPGVMVGPLVVYATNMALEIGDINNDGKNEVVIGLEKESSDPEPPFRIGIYTCA